MHVTERLRIAIGESRQDHKKFLHPNPLYARWNTNLCQLPRYFLWFAPEQTVVQVIEMQMIWDTIELIMTSL